MTAELWDVNAWLALSLSEHSHHQAMLERLNRIAEPGSVLFCRSTQQSYLRLLTSAAVLAPYGNDPLTNQQAWNAYWTLLADDRVATAEEPHGVESQWVRLAARATASPKLWMDAYLAAFAQTAGCRLVTSDKAFRQFDGLDLVVVSAAGS